MFSPTGTAILFWQLYGFKNKKQQHPFRETQNYRLRNELRLDNTYLYFFFNIYTSFF